MNREQKMMLVRISVSAGLLLLGYIVLYMVEIENVWRSIIFCIPYFIIGWDVIWRAVLNILHGKVFDEHFLMTVATVGAFAIGEYPEAVAVMLFYQVGELFQDYAVLRSRRSIAQLMDIRPDYANFEKDGKVVKVSPHQVMAGDVIVVKPGEKVPLDGEVLQGCSRLNTAALTGESSPTQVSAGDSVVSGCVNETGLIRVKTTKVYGQSTVAKILDLVENASGKKAKAENFITRFARYYTPFVVIAALALAIVPPLIFSQDWGEWIGRSLIFLVISCPCALVLSIPLSFFGGIGGASRQGILVKGGNYLEALARMDTVVFDKTGTLTKGDFQVSAVHPSEITEQQLLEYAVLAESYSNHPISSSLQSAYRKSADKTRVDQVQEIAGRGIKALVDGKKVLVGNSELMEDTGVKWRPCHLVGTLIHVAVNDVYAGHIIISDKIKADSFQAVAMLKKQGVKNTIMLTGDSKAVGNEVAKKLKIDHVYCELMPADKVDHVERLLKQKDKKSCLAFVGDGINDAPVLMRADVGIAMGALGSDAAIEAADVVLMDDKPSKIVAAKNIAKKTIAIVRQTIVFALGVKVVVLFLGAFGIANMWEAVFADVGVTLLAVLNAARAFYFQKR